MTNKICCLVLTLLIFSCKRDVDNSSYDANCIVLTQHADWVTTEFRSQYTIQFPNNYSIAKQQGYEGIVYDVKRDDNSVRFRYIYCNSMACYGFDNLPASFPDHVVYEAWGISKKLDQKATFCDGNMLTGVLYYNNDNDSYAKLYWKEDGKYMEAMQISYNHSRHQEVLDIIKTIRKK